jgi:hypothetical protein
MLGGGLGWLAGKYGLSREISLSLISYRRRHAADRPYERGRQRCSNGVQPSRRAGRVGLPVEATGPGSKRRWTRELSDVMRPFTTGSDYVNQFSLETDEGSERIKAAYGAN